MANIYILNVPTDYDSISGAIGAIINSGLTDYDRGIINIETSGSYIASGVGCYQIPSGTLEIGSTENNVHLDSMYFLNSGNIQVSNVRIDLLSISGYGQLQLFDVSGSTISASGLSSVNITSGVIGTLLDVTDSDSLILNDVYSSGNCKYNITRVSSVNISSGDYSNYDDTGFKLTLDVCSGIYINKIKGANISGNLLLFSGCPDITMNHASLASNISGYTMTAFVSGGGLACSGLIEYSIIVGNAGSGMGPFDIYDAQFITVSGCCIYNFIDDETYTGLSGFYFNKDPLFVNASGGDLRPDINSPCVSNADSIEIVEALSGVTVETVQLNKEAIKFYLRDQDIKAVIPSGIYVVGSGLAVFFKADPSLDNNMDILIHKQYKVLGSGITFQSFQNTAGIIGFDSDYKLIPYIDYASNAVMYYVQPFTMLSFSDMVNSASATLQDIEVSGKFKYNGFTRDRFQDSDGTPLYWVGEEYNNYLYGYSILSNEKVMTYPLFNSSGVSPSVTLSDLNYLSRTSTQANIWSDKVYVDDHYESRNISIDNQDGIFKFKSFEKDTSLGLEAIGTLGDWLVVSARQQYKDDSDVVSTKHNLYFYNKYEINPFEEPIKVFSGVIGLDDVTIGDLTFNDVGNLLISVSGYINFYKLFYDYALLTRLPNGTIKSTLLFREDYTGVKL
ncbi:MAG TPA: hypothetical protein VI911_11150 [Patescibacteria group bacterium]|nr:hypothetical protein [Patescibacteria group bacterium]